jgi:hypothetical protein
LPQIIEELRSYLIGWRSYFGFCQTPRVLTNFGSVDPPTAAYVSLAAVEEWAQTLQGAASQRYCKTPCCGRRGLTHGVLANVRTSRGSKGTAQPRLRFSRPASHLRCKLKLNPVEPPRYGPVCQVVWEGRRREASPYPDQTPSSAGGCWLRHGEGLSVPPRRSYDFVTLIPKL